MQRGLPERRKIKDVRKVIAVSSAKGGVGKSTLAGPHVPSQTLRLVLNVPQSTLPSHSHSAVSEVESSIQISSGLPFPHF